MGDQMSGCGWRGKHNRQLMVLERAPQSHKQKALGVLLRDTFGKGRIGLREKLTQNEFQQIQSGALRLDDPVPLSQTERYLASCSHWPQSAPCEV